MLMDGVMNITAGGIHIYLLLYNKFKEAILSLDRVTGPERKRCVCEWNY